MEIVDLRRSIDRLVRTSIQRDLAEAGLWTPIDDYELWLGEQNKLGKFLRTSVLSPILGPRDARLAINASRLGPLKGRLAVATPRLLAFGYGLGRGFSAAIGPSPSETASVDAAIFNFGIALFDALWDSGDPALTKQLLASGTLKRLLHEPSAMRCWVDEADNLASPEIRILRKVTGWYIGRLPQAGDIVDMITRAHIAEVESANSTLCPEDQLTWSREKSTLPFSIIGERCRNLIGGPESHANPAGPLIESVGRMLWLTDDLADVIEDERKGASNSLLLEGQIATKDWSQSSDRLRWILDSGVIARTSRAIRGEAAKVCDELGGTDEGRCFRRSLLQSVRNWFGTT